MPNLGFGGPLSLLQGIEKLEQVRLLFGGRPFSGGVNLLPSISMAKSEEEQAHQYISKVEATFNWRGRLSFSEANGLSLEVEDFGIFLVGEGGLWFYDRTPPGPREDLALRIALGWIVSDPESRTELLLDWEQETPVKQAVLEAVARLVNIGLSDSTIEKLAHKAEVSIDMQKIWQVINAHRAILYVNGDDELVKAWMIHQGGSLPFGEPPYLPGSEELSQLRREQASWRQANFEIFR